MPGLAGYTDKVMVVRKVTGDVTICLPGVSGIVSPVNMQRRFYISWMQVSVLSFP